jgi:predicted ribosome-associated RNA-binding protein Tma20
MSKVLCIVKYTKLRNGVAIIGLVGDSSEDNDINSDDHVTCYGCKADNMICVGSAMVPAREISAGTRVWLEQEELIDSIHGLPPKRGGSSS